MRYLQFLALLAFALAAQPAWADGIDLGVFLTRINSAKHSAGAVWGIIAAAMLANYILNLIVIGIPARKFGGESVTSVLVGMVFLTAAGQIADRIGWLITLILTIFFFGLDSNYNGPLSYLLFFICCGAPVAALALFFLRHVWFVPTRPAWITAAAAGTITNSCWAAYFMPQGGF
jgi:hypothetical protein